MPREKEQTLRDIWCSQHLPTATAKTPRHYQTEVFESLDRHLNTNKRAMTHLATGAGKTYIAMQWLRRQISEGKVTTKKPIVWMVHRSTLLIQAMKELFAIPMTERKRLGLSSETIAVLGGTLNDSLSNGRLREGENNQALIYFTTRQSFASIYSSFSKTPSFIVWDECHQGDGDASQQAPTIFQHFRRRKTKIIGLTATPKGESCTFSDDDVIYSKNLVSLIEEGHLARPKPVTVRTDVSWTPNTGSVRNADFTNTSELNTIVRNARIVNEYVANKKKYGKTVVFAINIDHAEALVRAFKKSNVTATYVHSKMSPSIAQEHIADYLNGRKEVIINVSKLAEGFDAPQTNSIFMCRPTNSRTLYLQSIGRGTRIPEGSTKDSFYVVDFVDNLTRHQDSLVASSRLFASRSRVRRRQWSPQMRERVTNGEHFFESGQTPSLICEADGLPDSMKGFWYAPGQTFGLEIELTCPNWQNRAVFRKWANRIIKALTAEMGSDLVYQNPCRNGAGLTTLWNVEWDASCGLEVVSPVLQGIEGIQELTKVLAVLDRLTQTTPIHVNYSTGLHLHLGFSGAKVDQVKALVLQMHLAEPCLAALVSRSRYNRFLGVNRYGSSPNSFCQPIRKMLTKKDMRECTSKRALLSAFGDRYCTLNLQPLQSIQTVEFRLHNGTTDMLKVVRWLSLCQQLFHHAIQQTDWQLALKHFKRRSVIEPASAAEVSKWLTKLPGGNQENFVQSVLGRVRTLQVTT